MPCRSTVTLTGVTLASTTVPVAPVLMDTSLKAPVRELPKALQACPAAAAGATAAQAAGMVQGISGPPWLMTGTSQVPGSSRETAHAKRSALAWVVLHTRKAFKCRLHWPSMTFVACAECTEDGTARGLVLRPQLKVAVRSVRTHPEPVYVRLFAVMLMARTSPTREAVSLKLLVLRPGPSTTAPEPLLVTDWRSPPVGGAVTWQGQGRVQRQQE